jgi:glucose-6-phosphate dehydrogenase assembly protein OpcA
MEAAMIELKDVSATEIATQFIKNRMSSGSPVMGMVMTFVVVASTDEMDQAIKAAQLATHEHPARLLGVTKGSGRGTSRIDAQVSLGQDGWSGELARIELSGEVVSHAESVVLPLLLPDSPVAIWWPGQPPSRPGEDPLGRLAQRRITDVATTAQTQTRFLRTQCSNYAAGNTDLAWSRTTPWRALLASTLDHHEFRIRSCEVSSGSTSASALLLRSWLSKCLKVPVSKKTSAGPGITKVVLKTDSGDIVVDRSDSANLATFEVPGRPPVLVALKQRDVAECLTEELRRFDEDEVYRETVQHVCNVK